MNTHGQSPSARPQPAGVNPFARALAEARGAIGGEDGSQFNANSQSSETTPQSQEVFNPAEKQRQLLEQQRRERMRQQLHQDVNRLNQKDVYDAKRQQAKQEVEQIRGELQQLMKGLNNEVEGLAKDIDIALMGEVVEVGETAKGAKGYFAKVKEFILLLQQKVHSARTWATTLSGKQSKQAGLNFKAKGHGQTKNVWDTMHHERQIARAGG